ncbi:Ras-related protein Rab-6A [Tritrichomonas foetus]|uniref:Ras-related protein Rab-6A n=1 Tax=Tritrichomonas foetus TaxID=1144522 RepID=A0A1J4KXB0_9EUKA|nr:Ras-related protein Rab-6A [Tritrichomonas foetus]|eukprot:OHT14340.1 Ras-related protein Rab-6A [Tritrichomonas foetus]
MVDRSARVVLIGNPSVGKTSLVKSLYEGRIDPKYEATIGAAFYTFSTVKNNETLSMQIWDTAGQEKYKSLGPVYYRNAYAAVIVYDISNPDSFNALQSWIDAFVDVTGNTRNIIIVGNKQDLASTQGMIGEGEKWAKSRNYKFFITSALTGYNVRYMFEAVLEMVTNIDKSAMIHSAEPSELDERKCSC